MTVAMISKEKVLEGRGGLKNVKLVIDDEQYTKLVKSRHDVVHNCHDCKDGFRVEPASTR
jgi:hypothetical protein